ncbi:MAG: sensor histidine kinase [Eubacteriales bacterium]|nr:sensor histidine kinase [Eubacteriales bacterium]
MNKNNSLFKLYKKVMIYILLVIGIQFVLQLIFFHRVFANVEFINRTIVAIFINLLISVAAICMVLCIHYKKLEKIEKAILMIKDGIPVKLPEKGITAEISASINKTSEIISEQQRIIEKRDNARIEWIRGVSHDIRTPLSMIMGYSEALEEDERLGAEERHSASVIKEQSILMKSLIDDLNLTSKLEYDKQPLRLTAFYPAELLREVVAVKLNSENAENFDITLLILPEFEKLCITADKNLIRRVFDNIIGNSFKHNSDGCNIIVLAYVSNEKMIVEMTDDGRGIPEYVAGFVNSYGSEFESEDKNSDDETDRPHIMGMRIAKQIMLTQGGNMIVKPDRHTIAVIL